MCFFPTNQLGHLYLFLKELGSRLFEKSTYLGELLFRVFCLFGWLGGFFFVRKIFL